MPSWIYETTNSHRFYICPQCLGHRSPSISKDDILGYRKTEASMLLGRNWNLVRHFVLLNLFLNLKLFCKKFIFILIVTTLISVNRFNIPQRYDGFTSKSEGLLWKNNPNLKRTTIRFRMF